MTIDDCRCLIRAARTILVIAIVEPGARVIEGRDALRVRLVFLVLWWKLISLTMITEASPLHLIVLNQNCRGLAIKRQFSVVAEALLPVPLDYVNYSIGLHSSIAAVLQRLVLQGAILVHLHNWTALAHLGLHPRLVLALPTAALALRFDFGGVRER